MRAGDSQCAPHRKGRAHCPEAIANAIRTEDQEGLPHTVEHTHVLADDGLDGLVPPLASAVDRWCCNVLGDEHPRSGEVVGTRIPP